MSIDKRGENRWRIRVTYRGRTFTKNFEGTETQAVKEETKFKEEVRTGRAALSRMTLEQFVAGPYQKHLRDLAPKTKMDYEYQLKHRVIPYMGKYPLEEVTPHLIQDFYDSLVEEGVGPRTVKKNAQVISAVLSEAVYLQYLTTNAAKRVRSPKYKRKRDDNFLTAEEAIQLLAALEGYPATWRLPLQIALFTGARVGEILGLTWADINFIDKTIRIARSRQVLTRESITKNPKNDSSIRVVPIPDTLVDILKVWRVEQGQNVTYLGQELSSWVVTMEDGTPMPPSAANYRLKKTLRDHGIAQDKAVTFHGLRHTYATLLLHSKEVPSFAIAGNLGHSDPHTHKRIYAHQIDESNRAAATYMDKLFSEDMKRREAK